MGNKDTYEGRSVERELVDIVTERAVVFMLAGKKYLLYCPTIGKLLITNRIMEDEAERIGAEVTYEHLATAGRRVACRILAYAVLHKKADIMNEEIVSGIADDFDREMDEDDIVTLLSAYHEMGSYERVKRHYRMTDDDGVREQVGRIKASDNVLRLGGRTLYGRVLDPMCERYGWSLDYALWGISYVNAMMMLSDIDNSVNLTDDEKRQIGGAKRVAGQIDGDDPANAERIAKLLDGLGA